MRDGQTGRWLRPSAAIALALTCAVSVVAPAIASATTVSADRACYRPGQSALISDEGHKPLTAPERVARDLSGFNDARGQTLYAHYLFRGRLYRTVAVGRLKGPCGTMARRARQFPFRPARAGTWSIKVDTSRRYPNRSRGRTYRNVRVRPPDALR